MPFPDYTSLVQYDNILHLWKLDEESGTRSDFIASCHLTDNNTVLYGSGKIGNGADFEDDNDEYLSATSDSSSDMNFTSGNFSISFWIKAETLISYTYVCRGLGNNDGYHISYSLSSDKLYFQTFQSEATQTTWSTISPLSIGTLIHITLVRNGTNTYIFKNGSDITGDTESVIDPATCNRILNVGRYEAASGYVDGVMDELIVWNVALSSAEVSTLYSWYSKVGLSGAISFSGDLGRKPKKILTGTISFIGTLQKLPKIVLTGAISFAGVLSKLPKKTLTGAITFTGTLIRLPKILLTGSISFIGQIITKYFDGIWNLPTKIPTTWTEKDKETTAWTAQDKEDTDWTAQD